MKTVEAIRKDDFWAYTLYRQTVRNSKRLMACWTCHKHAATLYGFQEVDYAIDRLHPVSTWDGVGMGLYCNESCWTRNAKS